jgi:choice-of-anchor B domain-containing protein
VACYATNLSAQTYRTDNPLSPALTGFGSAVAIAGDEVLVAEPLNATKPGLVYVYRKDRNGTWTEAAQLKASDASNLDRFGRWLAVDGSTLVIGATSRDSSKGGAYVFQRGGNGAWAEVARLLATDAKAGDALGRSVALSGRFALVGSAGHNGGAGAAYLFRRDDAGRWSQHAKLAPAVLQPNDFFGFVVALDGENALVAAVNRQNRQGAVFAYRHEAASDTWRELGTLPGTGLAPNTGFGAAMALKGGRALVAAPGLNGFTGAVLAYRFDADSGAWVEDGQLLPLDLPAQSQFGSSISFDGAQAWIGALTADRGVGRVYGFMLDPAAGWTEARPIAVDGLEPGDLFGGTVAVQGKLGVAGLVNDDFGEGSAVIFERTGADEWRAANRVLSVYENLPAVTGGKVECRSGMAAGFDCESVDLQAFLPVQAIGGGRGARVNDIWGWTDPETGREYALVGRVDGTAFVDVTDPVNPIYLGSLPLTAGAQPSIWRDIKVHKDHAFIVADNAGEHGMQVFDLTQLRAVRAPPVTFAETALYRGIHSAHNIVINEETGFAYTVGNGGGGETCGGGSHMVNIQDPKNPTFAGCFAHANTGRRGTGYTHDSQCVTYRGPDAEHQGREICFASNETALSIADVTDKANPRPLASAAYPNVAYSHQGWLTDDHRYFYMDDEGDESAGTAPTTRTLIWDVSDLDDPVLVKEHFGTTGATDHNLYIKGRYMYQSNYLSGLRVLDISDVANPVEVAYFDTVPYGENNAEMSGSWSNYPFFKSGTIVVTSMREGLFVLTKREVNLVP